MKALLWFAALFLLLFTACSPLPPPPPPQPSPTSAGQAENTPTTGLGTSGTPTAEPESTSTPTAGPDKPLVPTPTEPSTSTPTLATGTITGRTIFNSDTTVPNIPVKLDDGAFSTTSGADGSFTLSGIPAGSHTISARATGVGSSELNVFVTPNETYVQDLVLFIFFELTAHPPAPTRTPQKNVPEGGSHSWADAWVLNFGTMKLTQNGKEVSGVYHNELNGASGTIHGTVSGNEFKGVWKNDRRSGALHWELSPDGNSFDGSFNGSSAWCGARPGKPFPDGCSFSGEWVSVFEKNQKCLVKLTRTDLVVKGTFCNGKINGKISYLANSNDTLLSGTWSGSSSGPFRLFLLGYNGLQFQGDWNEKNAWCGWRADQKAPSPCLR